MYAGTPAAYYEFCFGAGEAGVMFLRSDDDVLFLFREFIPIFQGFFVFFDDIYERLACFERLVGESFGFFVCGHMAVFFE